MTAHVIMLILALGQTWNSSGLSRESFNQKQAPSGPAPRRDLTGIWDSGPVGVQPTGHVTPPLTAWGQEKLKEIKPGNGPRAVTEEFINDPLSINCDPTGFPRQIMYEFRPSQIIQTPNQIVIFYMFGKTWRVIWTDGRELPRNPEPRWYGYSVGRWEDDYTFVAQSVGMDERTWLDNAGNPHSENMRVEERYHRVDRDTLELTVTIDDPTTYTRPWIAYEKLPLRLMPADTDFREQICSPTEAAAYKKLVDTQKK